MASQIQTGPTGPTRVAQPVTMVEKSGTINTSAGPINWSRADDGTVTASGNGQQLTMTVSHANDGSSQTNLVFSRSGQSPYLTIMQTVVQQTQNTATLTVTAAQSHLTLALTGFNRSYSSATATVSGSFVGSAATAGAAVARRVSPGTIAQNINWTGTVDLTKNPLMGNFIPGWPQDAFASELKAAAFFAPLGKAVLPQVLLRTTTGGFIGRAVAAAALGALVAVGTGGTGLVILIAAVGGADGSMINDDINEWEEQTQGPPVEPIQIDNIPTDPEPIGPTTQTVPDDPPPPPPTDPEPTGPSTQTQPNDPPPPPPSGGGDGGDQEGGGGGGGGSNPLDTSKDEPQEQN